MGGYGIPLTDVEKQITNAHKNFVIGKILEICQTQGPTKGNDMTTATTLRWRKKPIVIEAFQLTRERRANNADWPEWMNAAWNEGRGAPGALYPTVEGTGDGTLSIATLEGEHLVSFDDWIIRGVKGELYPCKPDIFRATYEPAVGPSPAQS